MGSIPAELSLDCRPSFIPKSITDFLRQLSLIRNVPDKLSQIDDYITRLEDEMRKIDAFKRELPLSVLLVKDAIVALREESMQYRKSRTEPVLEEFIPLKKSSHEDTKAEITKDKDSTEKMSWMSSVQLWNSESHCENTDEVINKQPSKSELKVDTQRSPEEGNSSVTEDPFQSCKTMNVGKAFSVPFKGYSSFSATAVRKDNKDELPGLSLHTPGITKLREDTVTSGLNSKHNGSRGGLSTVAGCQSNMRSGSLSQQQSARKQRRCWSPELHRRFVDALQQLGGSQVATPKQIRELMQVDGLTNDEVKSHLQKYRLHTRRVPNSQTQPANQSGVALGNLWMSQGQYGESSKQSSSQSGSPQGPLHLAGSCGGTSTTVGDSMEEEDDVKSENHSWKTHVLTSGKIDGALYVDQELICLADVLPEEVKNKIIKQVEYQLSDMSLLANENLLRQMNKDLEGFVPISSVSATKKIKSLITNQQTLAHALLSSTKLIVSNDGKKVKRRIPFTDKDKEDLQLRTVVAENLPDDHSHHNIEKIFKVAGSVKTIRICHPQDPNLSRARGDIGISNKLHALIEFENPEAAERAVEKLNDERNWRKGLRVRLLLRRSPKSILKIRKCEFEGCFDDEDGVPSEDSDSNNVEDGVGSAKKAWNKGRGKLRMRPQIHSGRGLLAALPQSSSSSGLGEGPVRQVTKGPRMPDGTRGFTMGRGKPLTATVISGVHVA